MATTKVGPYELGPLGGSEIAERFSGTPYTIRLSRMTCEYQCALSFGVRFCVV
jgi:hypothetical protein